MTALRPDGAAAFAARRDCAGLLAFGPDETRAEELVRAIVKSVAGTLDDPFRVARIEDSLLLGDPARLADELQSQSMFGGRRIVWIEGAGAGLLKALKLLPEKASFGNIWAASAGDLPRASALRQFCEDADTVGAVVCYEDSSEDVRRLVLSSVSSARLRIDDDALEVLCGLLEGNRQSSRSEINKLLTYCFGHESIGLADVLAACCSTGESVLDSLVDAVLGGDLAEADSVCAALLFEGESPSRLVLAAALHAGRLQDLLVEMALGKSVDAAVKGARPPLFFKRHGAIAAQLRNWTEDRIASAASSLHAAVFACRESAALESEIASRALLSVARAARAK